jgi:hypothetical protein
MTHPGASLSSPPMETFAEPVPIAEFYIESPRRGRPTAARRQPKRRRERVLCADSFPVRGSAHSLP